VEQTCLFDPESESNRRQQRWVGLAEQVQQEVVTLLVQFVIAMQQSSNTEERDNDRDGQ